MPVVQEAPWHNRRSDERRRALCDRPPPFLSRTTGGRALMRRANFARGLLVGLLLLLLPACDGDDDTGGGRGGIPTSGSLPKESTECTYEGDISELIACVEKTGVEEPSEPVEVALSGTDPPQSQVEPENPFPYTVQEYLNYIIGDVDRVWSEWFHANGLQSRSSVSS